MWKKNERATTLVLIYLAGIFERADESLLPGVYREIGVEVHASPTSLGSLTLLRSVIQTLCFPLAAYLAMHHDRASVIALGAFLWALPTFCVGISSTFLEVAVARAVTGLGLAIVTPAMHSLIADLTESSSRGVAFGWLQFTGGIGSTLGSITAVLLAGTSVWGVQGWRVAFFLISFISAAVAFMVYAFAADPHSTGNRRHTQIHKTDFLDVRDLVMEGKKVMRIKTFQVIVAQGVLRSFPWAGLGFSAMWLELIGFSHSVTAILLGTFTLAVSLGGLFGGRLGDILSTRLPNTGRIILSQISSGTGPPLAAVLLLALPYKSSTALLHGLVMLVMGFLTSWNAPATNSPIFAEIVPEKSRTLTYALDRSFESILASFAPPIVGLLAENIFGYAMPEEGVNDTSPNANHKNAIALGRAIFTAYAIPLGTCCMIYTLLYYTYPKDRDKAQEAPSLDFQKDASETAQSYQLIEISSKKTSGLQLDTNSDEKGKVGSPRADDSEVEMMLHENTSSDI